MTVFQRKKIKKKKRNKDKNDPGPAVVGYIILTGCRLVLFHHNYKDVSNPRSRVIRYKSS